MFGHSIRGEIGGNGIDVRIAQARRHRLHDAGLERCRKVVRKVPGQRNFWRRAIDRRIVTGGAPGLEQGLAVRDDGGGGFSGSGSPLGGPSDGGPFLDRGRRQRNKQHEPRHEAEDSGFLLHTSPGA